MAAGLMGATVGPAGVWRGLSSSGQPGGPEDPRGVDVGRTLARIDSFTGSKAGSQLEEWVARVLQALGYEVRRVGGPGDHGADLILEGISGPTVVQVKWSAKDPIGPQGVRDVLMAQKYHRATSALLVSNQEFTRQAREEASHPEVGVTLWGRKEIRDILEDQRSHPPAPVNRDWVQASGATFAEAPVTTRAGRPADRWWTVSTDLIRPRRYLRRVRRGLFWRAGVILSATIAASFGLHVWLAEFTGLLAGGCVITRGQGGRQAASAWRAAALGIGLAANPWLLGPPTAVLGALALALVEALITARPTGHAEVFGDHGSGPDCAVVPSLEAA